MIPPNEKGALVHAPIPKLLAGYYHLLYSAQAVPPRWQREATRLLDLYSRTGNPKHLVAFGVHIAGMRLRLLTERT